VTYKAFRNLPDVQLLLVGELNAYDVLCNDWVVFTRDTLPGAVAGEGDVATQTSAPVAAPETTEEPEAAEPAAAPEPEPAPEAAVAAEPAEPTGEVAE
jgi:hypothetical protein